MINTEKKPGKVSPVPVSHSTNVYLKALPLRSLHDVDNFKEEVKNGNILILRVTPLAKVRISDVRKAINELCDFVEKIGGDIARLGEERVVIVPRFIRIWREKTVAPKKKVSTAT